MFFHHETLQNREASGYGGAEIRIDCMDHEIHRIKLKQAADVVSSEEESAVGVDHCLARDEKLSQAEEEGSALSFGELREYCGKLSRFQEVVDVGLAHRRASVDEEVGYRKEDVPVHKRAGLLRFLLPEDKIPVIGFLQKVCHDGVYAVAVPVLQKKQTVAEIGQSGGHEDEAVFAEEGGGFRGRCLL